MRPNQKNRNSRNKNRGGPKPLGNVVNRVFESAGPEGKVRGTPQQIIDKYQLLARDAQTSNDRVMAESFLQHAEHYARMLSAAYEQAEERRREQVQADASRRGDGDDDSGDDRSWRRDDRDDRSDEGRDESDGRGVDARGDDDGDRSPREERDRTVREERDRRPREDAERRPRRRDREERAPAAAQGGEGGGAAASGESRGLETFDTRDEPESGPIETPEGASANAAGTEGEAPRRRRARRTPRKAEVEAKAEAEPQAEAEPASDEASASS